MDNINISNKIRQFLNDNGIDINDLSDFNFIVNGRETAAKDNDFDYTLTASNLVYKNSVVDMVHIRDIVGTFLPHAIDDINFLSLISYLYNNDNEYSERSLDKLNGDILSNVENIISSETLINLNEIGGKYYVGFDGNHRTFYLMLAYLTLKEKYKNDSEKIKQIEEQFYIKADVTKKTGYEMIDKICYCLSKCWNDDIKLSLSDNSDMIGILQICNNTYTLKTEQEFIGYFNNYLMLLDKTSEKYINLDKQLNAIGYSASNVNIKDNNANKLFRQNKQINQIKDIMLKLKNYASDPNAIFDTNNIYTAFRNYGIPENIIGKQYDNNTKQYILSELYKKEEEHKLDIADGSLSDAWQFFYTNRPRDGRIPNYQWKVYIPLNPLYYAESSKSIIDFLCDNTIVSNSKISGQARSDSMVVNLENYDDVLKLRRYINTMPKYILSTHHPFIPDLDGLGIVHTYDTVSSYTERLSDYLAKFVNYCKQRNRLDWISIEGFMASLENSLKNGTAKDPDSVEQLINHLNVIMNSDNSIDYENVDEENIEFHR